MTHTIDIFPMENWEKCVQQILSCEPAHVHPSHMNDLMTRLKNGGQKNSRRRHSSARHTTGQESVGSELDDADHAPSSSSPSSSSLQHGDAQRPPRSMLLLSTPAAHPPSSYSSS